MEFSFVNILSFLLLSIVFFMAFRVYKYMQATKQTLEDLLINKSTVVFKLIQTASTGIEVVGLSLMAISRGITPFNAFSRYLLIGFAEALLTILFIIVLEQSLRKAAKDGIITISEIITTIIKSSVFFTLAFFMTGQIYLMYLESINQIEFQQPNFLTLLLPIFGADIETNIEYFSEAMANAEGLIIQERIEYGAVVMIFVTPLFNIISLPFVIREVCSGAKVKLFRSKTDKANSKANSKASSTSGNNSSQNPTQAPNQPTGDADTFNRFAKLMSPYTGTQLYKNYKQLCGLESGSISKHSSINDASSLEAFQKNFMKVITGVNDLNTPSGILGYEKLNAEIDNIKNSDDYSKILKDLATAKSKVSTETDSSKISGLNREVTRLEREQDVYDIKIKKYGDSKMKIEKEMKDYCKQIKMI